jgi:GTPase involved in cell partitioning and DNA repair
MIKLHTILGLIISSIVGLTPLSMAFAKEDACLTLVKEIAQLEKDLVTKNKTLAKNKLELEKLPPESTSKKMKLTADTFVVAAESEATQNWLVVKRKEKIKNCANR